LEVVEPEPSGNQEDDRHNKWPRRPYDGTKVNTEEICPAAFSDTGRYFRNKRPAVTTPSPWDQQIELTPNAPNDQQQGIPPLTNEQKVLNEYLEDNLEKGLHCGIVSPLRIPDPPRHSQKKDGTLRIVHDYDG